MAPEGPNSQFHTAQIHYRSPPRSRHSFTGLAAVLSSIQLVLANIPANVVIWRKVCQFVYVYAIIHKHDRFFISATSLDVKLYTNGHFRCV